MKAKSKTLYTARIPAPDYGKPAEVSLEVREWFQALDKKKWRRSYSNGMHHAFEEGELTDDEVDRVLEYVAMYRLPCVLSSGCYGQLSMRIFDHTSLQEAVVGSKPLHLFTLGQDHLEWKDRSFKGWDYRFKWFSAFTHSTENCGVLEFYGFGKPGSKDYYEY